MHPGGGGQSSFPILEASMKDGTSKANPANRPARRNFLLALGAGGAATAAAVIGSGVAKSPEAVSVTDTDGKGYQDSAHVRNYYRSTRI
jgi:hypothetical protein